jgi:DNA-binding MurR/RpiR family transcriptional regulator
MGEQENLGKVMSIINKESFIKVVDILAKTKSITFFAVGSSYPVAYDAFWRFSKIGILCKIQQDWAGQLMIAQCLGKSDVAFAISRSGQSKIPIKALKIAKENGAITICLTQNRKSDIVKNSDYFLISSERLNMIYDAATFSRVAHLSIIDAIYSAVTIKKWNKATKSMKKINILLDSETF